ncbi:YcnI family protein [Jiangella gansuensis]|uniref:YcnI family copper-binding membrane protein n=1 Tax=Jiangella gansuensis TaxID=281473 RepID=UPI00047EB95B|nr:YcnI family protein [Jiangella gansuensis]
MIIHRRAVARASLTAAGAIAAGLLLTATASAHVTIRPDIDTAGSYSKITVRVPNESDTAGTTQVRLDLPADTPFASVRVQPRQGWTAEVTRTQFPEPVEVGDRVLEEAVTSVTWTAEPGVRIGPDEFDEFAISVGPLPDPGTYYLPATQTYDDGEVVAWAEEPAEDGAEPERPAPVLTVVAAPEGGDAHAVSDSSHESSGSDDADDAAASSGDGSTDGLARGVGIGGVVVGAAGLGLGAAALRRRNA